MDKSTDFTDILIELQIETNEEQKQTEAYKKITIYNKNRFERLPKWGNEGYEAESIEILASLLSELETIKLLPQTRKSFDACVVSASE